VATVIKPTFVQNLDNGNYGKSGTEFSVTYFS